MFHAVGSSRGRSSGLGSRNDPSHTWKGALRCGLVFCAISAALFIIGVILTWLGVHDVFGESVPITGPILLSVGSLMLLLGSRQFYVARTRYKEAKIALAAAAEVLSKPGEDDDDLADDEEFKDKDDESYCNGYSKPLVAGSKADHPGYNGTYYYAPSVKQTATSMALMIYKDLALNYTPFTPALGNGSIPLTNMAGNTCVSPATSSLPGYTPVPVGNLATVSAELTPITPVTTSSSLAANESTSSATEGPSLVVISDDNHQTHKDNQFVETTFETLPEAVTEVPAIPSVFPAAADSLTSEFVSYKDELSSETVSLNRDTHALLNTAISHSDTKTRSDSKDVRVKGSAPECPTPQQHQVTPEFKKIFPSDYLKSNQRTDGRNVSATDGIRNFPKSTAFFMLRTLELQETI